MAWRFATILLTAVFLSGAAQAIPFRTIESGVLVDTFVRANTEIQDLDPATARTTRVQSSKEVFVDVNAATAVAVSTSVVVPPTIKAPQILTESILSIEVTSEDDLSAEAFARAEGFIEFDVVVSDVPASAAVVLFGLERKFEFEDPFLLEFSVLDLNSGESVVSFSGEPPPLFSFPVAPGDSFRVEFVAELDGFVEGEGELRREIKFTSELNPIPEPHTLGLLALGLGGLLAHRAARARR